jgi:predicted phage tail component-like protein
MFEGFGGFTFKGVHSSTYGVFETPEDRVLSPLKRRTLITIPGRNTAFVQEDGGYDARVESISCSFAQESIPTANLQRQVRLIAGWLSGMGELTFDYEPEMHYYAFLSNAPPTVKHLQYAQFTLEFTCNHPFAYETAISEHFTITDKSPITIQAEGTVETPIRMVIKNTSNKPIQNLAITRRFINN